MADFQLKVTAETQRAERDLQRLDRTANEATKERSIKIQAPNIGSAAKSFSDLGKNLNSAANDIKKFYGVAKQLPGIGDSIKRYEGAIQGTAKATSTLANNTKAGEILSHSFEKAGSAVGTLVNNLAKVGFALFGIKEVVGILQAAFGGFFDQTIGREIKLRETILKTQTTLASTNKVFKNGQEITDPYQKIVALTGTVAKHIDSIRERSIALAGVTSNEVIEVFGIVASQVGQIGGGLKEAEDLAINFAAALGTFGIPLYQARQEIGSILRGDITTDSYLAKALGITNEDVEKAKSQAGGVTKFLEERLAAAVAGQKIAAQGFAGVISNIKDLYELIGQRFGAKLLDPLLNALASVFENLFRVKDQLFGIADAAGSALGRVAAIGREIRSRSGLVSLGEIGLEDNSGKQAINAIQDAVQDVIVLVEGAAQRSIGAIAQAINTLKPSVITVADAFVRLGRVFIEIKVDTFESIARVLANLTTAATPLLAVFTTLFNLYSRFLDLPIIKEFAKLATTMSVLKRAGMDFVTNLILVGNTIITVIVPAVGRLGIAFGVVIGGVGALVVAIGKLTLTLGGLAAALAGIPGIAAGVAKSLFDVSRNLNTTGQSSLQAGNNLGVVAGGFKNLGETAKLAGLNIIKSLGWTLLIQAAVTVIVNAFGEYQKAQEEATRSARATVALERLSSVYRNVGDDADHATKAARDFEKQLADAEYSRVIERLEEIRKKLNDLEYEAKEGIQTWGELWRILGRVANFQADPFGSLDSKEASKLLGEEARLREYARKYEKEQDKKQAKEKIDLEAQNRVNLEKELGDFRRQLENDIFQQRQNLAQKEIDAFRAAGELRIFQMEQANAKLIEGEEGASAAALEALNNYISTRERGELDIETSKKALAVEVANLEHELANYRIETEKKIAEIRKKAGENDMKLANARRQLESQPLAVGGNTGLTQGNTGTSSSGDHFHVAGAGSEAEARAIFANAAKLITTDRPGSPRSGGRTHAGYDLAGAPGTPLDLAPGYVLDPRNPFVRDPNGLGGNYANILRESDQKRYKIMHLRDPGKNWKPGTGNVPLPKLEDPSAVAAPAVDKYAAAMRGVASTLEVVRARQEALTNAKTAAAFDAIAKAAFQPVALEQYRDQIIQAEAALEALARTSGEAYSPEHLQIQVDMVSKIRTATAELQQLIKGFDVRTDLSDKEKKAAIEAQIDAHNKKVQSIRKEAVLREQVLDITRKQTAIERLRAATNAIRFEVARAGVQAQATMAQAFAGDDSAALRRIEAEQKIAEKRIELEEQFGKGSEEVTRDLTAFAEKTRSAASDLGALDEQVKAFTTQMATIRDVSKTLVDSYKGVAQSFLSGGNLKDAVNQMTKAITDKIVGIALDSAFKPMEEMFVKTLKDVFGMQDPTIALQEQNNQALTANTIALERATAVIASSAGSAAGGALPGTESEYELMSRLSTRGPAYVQEIEGMLEQEFKGIGESLTQLGTVAETTSKQTGNAAATGEKGFGKFLGAMTGVATGALAITGAIQAMQDSKGGTYETLMGIAGVLGGLGSIFGGISSLGKKAAGGPVNANRPYVVGEIGPELFVPSSNGTIIPNNRLSGNPYAASSDYLGQMGASNRALRNDPIRVDTRVINGVEYATADQLREATTLAERRGAERGRSLALGSLQNSVRARKQVGLA